MKTGFGLQPRERSTSWPRHLAAVKRTRTIQTIVSPLLLAICLGCCTAVANEAVQELSTYLGKTPALVVVVCSEANEDLATVTQLVEQTPWTILCRSAGSTKLGTLRDWAREQGHLGKRVYVVDDNTMSLYLAGGMADAVWVAPDALNPPSEDEILRVLRPNGVGVTAGKTLVKPADPGVDEWRHPYHGPDNNVVSQDGTARLPGELRFQTFPVFAAMPNQSLFAGGRIFFFTGHIAFHEREEPLLNTLTVLNAYNGLRLWSRPLDPSCVVHNFTKLATDREVVFAEGETLWILDAATGEERGKIAVPAEAAAAGDTDWKWVVQDNDMLWAAFGPPDGRVVPHRQKRQMGHWPWDVADAQYRAIVNNFGAARRLVCYQYPDMKQLWGIAETDAFDVRTLCMEGGRIFQLAPKKYVVARAAATGETLWRSTPKTSSKLFDAIGSALKRQGWGLGWATYCCGRAHDGVLCIAGPSFKQTIGIDLEKGDLLWTTDSESPHPFFLDDVLYVMPRVAAPAALCRKIDPRTGNVLGELSLGVIGSCTRLTVTPNQFYYRPGGGEGRTVYFDIAAQKLADYEGVVRPGCFDGVVPANGRLYWMPLACDCWQVHGTFCMAPRAALPAAVSPVAVPPVATTAWSAPTSTAPAAIGDWPMFRANGAGTATVPVSIPRHVKELWRQRLPGGDVTAPTCAAGRVLVGGKDGTAWALAAVDGKPLWQASSSAAIPFAPAYWNGRVVFGSCDGSLYCLDATDGHELGRLELSPEKRFVNIMDQLMSTWPLGGGVVLDDDGIAYAAAGSTAADGTVAVAVDVATGACRWRQAYTLDRQDAKLSFGVQGNLLLKNGTLFVNGGAPVGVVTLDAATGGNPRVVARLEAGMETFLDPADQPWCGGPELYCAEWARTTIFKRHQGRVYFLLADRFVALVDGRLFCSRDVQGLDRLVELMNTDPVTGGSLASAAAPRDVLQVPVDDSILWSSATADVGGVAVGTDGLVVLHAKSVEGVAADGRSLWSVPLPAEPVRWGVALTADHCVVSLTDGQVICLGRDSATN